MSRCSRVGGSPDRLQEAGSGYRRERCRPIPRPMEHLLHEFAAPVWGRDSDHHEHAVKLVEVGFHNTKDCKDSAGFASGNRSKHQSKFGMKSSGKWDCANSRIYPTASVAGMRVM